MQSILGDEGLPPVMLAATGGGRNTWLVGDEREVIAVDPVADPDEVLDVVDGRRVVAVVCTTDPHGNAAVATLGERTGAPVWATPHVGQEFTVGAVTLQVMQPPNGHRGVWLYSPTLGCVFTGDAPTDGGLGLPPETIIYPGHGG
ncbi:MBL fold metallo-hydrolase [Tessaracoccus lubricantis]|uniref:MBL fold metallo-hydrolase n=1 Tax=Tessaracoccus lubricantis TaxID=545543 RepID=A0ABP9F8V5_9ACTN